MSNCAGAGGRTVLFSSVRPAWSPCSFSCGTGACFITEQVRVSLQNKCVFHCGTGTHSFVFTAEQAHSVFFCGEMVSLRHKTFFSGRFRGKISASGYFSDEIMLSGVLQRIPFRRKRWIPFRQNKSSSPGLPLISVMRIPKLSSMTTTSPSAISLPLT